MLPSYILTIDIIAKNITIDEELFYHRVAPCLAYLDALKGSFDRSPCTKTYYQTGERGETYEWAVRGVVMVSVGKDRAEHLTQLYQAIAHLIELELFDFEVRAEIGKFQLS